MQTIEQKAERAYNAYNETSEKPWLSWDGKPVPRWGDLELTESGRIVQRKWIASTMAVLEGEPGVAVQAKVQVNGHNIRKWGPGEKDSTTEVVLNPVYGTGVENKSWSQATPGGEIKLLITNPTAIERLKIGQTFILDFRPVDK